MMKELVTRSLVVMFFLLNLTGYSYATSERTLKPEIFLTQMQSAMQESHYSLVFINISKQGVESLTYQHTLSHGQVIAKLQPLDGPEREIIQQGKQIRYVDSQGSSFLLTGGHIIDGLPNVIYADFAQLSHYYNFIPLGRCRIAGKRCDKIRIVARDGSRYSYVVWIDSQNHLLLKADLLDSNSDTLAQFRVLVVNTTSTMDKVALPATLLHPQIVIQPAAVKQKFDWDLNWLPEGMQQIDYRPLLLTNGTLLPKENQAESALYSDGLFTFIINILPIDKSRVLHDHTIYSGQQLVYSEQKQNHEIVIIGELPLITAKRIVQNLQFKTGYQ